MDRFLCKIRNAHIHRLGVSLDKRSAAGRACFVEHNIIDRTVFDLDTFHVLSADVQDKIHIRQEGSGRLIMSDGLNLTVVGAESRLDEMFAVARGDGIGDKHILMHF